MSELYAIMVYNSEIGWYFLQFQDARILVADTAALLLWQCHTARVCPWASKRWPKDDYDDDDDSPITRTKDLASAPSVQMASCNL